MEGSRIRKKTLCSSRSESEASPEGSSIASGQVSGPVDNFAKLGARAGLSFAFAFLKKTWRCGKLTNYLFYLLSSQNFRSLMQNPVKLYNIIYYKDYIA